MIEKKVSIKDLKNGVKLTSDSYNLTVVTPKKLIITCDDYGAIDEIDSGVERAIKSGSITSVAVFPNFTENLLNRPKGSFLLELREWLSDDDLVDALSTIDSAQAWLEKHCVTYNNYAQKVSKSLQAEMKAKDKYKDTFEIGAHLTIASGYSVLPPQYTYEVCTYTDEERIVIDEWYSDLNRNERKSIITEFGVLSNETKDKIVKLIKQINVNTKGNVKKWYRRKTKDVWEKIKIHCNENVVNKKNEGERIRDLCRDGGTISFAKWCSDKYSDKRQIIKMFLMVPRPYIYFKKVGSGDEIMDPAGNASPEARKQYQRMVMQFQLEMTAQMCVLKANGIDISFLSSHCGSHEQNSDFFKFFLKLAHHSKVAMRRSMVYPAAQRKAFKMLAQAGVAPTDKEMLNMLTEFNDKLETEEKAIIKTTSTMNSDHYGPVGPFKSNSHVKSNEKHLTVLQKKQKALQTMIHDLVKKSDRYSLEILVHAMGFEGQNNRIVPVSSGSEDHFHVNSDASLYGCNKPIDDPCKWNACSECNEYWNNCDDVKLYDRKSVEKYVKDYVDINYPQVNPDYYQARVVELQSIESPLYHNWKEFQDKKIELALWSELPSPKK